MAAIAGLPACRCAPMAAWAGEDGATPIAVHALWPIDLVPGFVPVPGRLEEATLPPALLGGHRATAAVVVAAGPGGALLPGRWLRPAALE